MFISSPPDLKGLGVGLRLGRLRLSAAGRAAEVVPVSVEVEVAVPA